MHLSVCRLEAALNQCHNAHFVGTAQAPGTPELQNRAMRRRPGRLQRSLEAALAGEAIRPEQESAEVSDVKLPASSCAPAKQAPGPEEESAEGPGLRLPASSCTPAEGAVGPGEESAEGLRAKLSASSSAPLRSALRRLETHVWHAKRFSMTER